MLSIAPEDRKLSDVAKELVLPPTIETTDFPLLKRQLDRISWPLDEWQKGLITAATGKRSDGLYAAGAGGVVISIGRQSGKTHTLGGLCFAKALAAPNTLIVWTAHRNRTHGETFTSMASMSERREIAPFVKNVRRVNGEQSIEFTNGSRILFGAREKGFGRGFAKVDVLIFDEAQILSLKAMEDMVPATNAAPNALVLFAGTPPRPTDPSETFLGLRKAALEGDPDLMYVELSANRDDDLEDREAWGRANPQYPHRVGVNSFKRMRKLLVSDDAFRREALGIWDEENVGNKAFKPGALGALVGSGDKFKDGTRAMGIKFDLDGVNVAVAGCVKRDGEWFIEGLRERPVAEGTQWLVDFLVDRADTIAAVAIDGRAGSGMLVNSLKYARFPKKGILIPRVDQVIAAHGGLHKAVDDGTLTIGSGQEALIGQADAAVKRKIGSDGGYGWDSPVEGESVCLLDAATMAFFASNETRRQPGRKQRFL